MEQVHAVPAAVSGARRNAWLGATAWLVGVAIAWWAVAVRELATAGLDDALRQAGATSGASMSRWLAVSTVFGRFGTLAFEALAYFAWWRSWGAPFRFGRFFVSVASFSLIDAWVSTLQALVRDGAPALAPWLAPVLGIGLLHEPGVSGGSAWQIAIGGLGLATAVRVALTARAQARETGRGLRGALILTMLAWLGTRAIVWWGIDLARGASPMP